MIKGRHNFFVEKFFDSYISTILRKDFHTINLISETEIRTPSSVLLVGNHFSWWDGFFAHYLNQKIFKKKFFVMMLEAELKKRLIFSYAGAFSIAPGSSTVNESLHYSCELLSNPDNLLLIFPQGKIQSQHTNSFNFGRSLEYILEHQQQTTLVFFASFTDYFSNRKPTVTIFLREMVNIIEPEPEYNIFFQDCKFKYIEIKNG